MQNMNKKDIEKISPFAFDGDILLSIEEQLELQENALRLTGNYAMSHKPIVIIADASILGINQLGNNVIILKRQTIKHVFKRHSSDGQEQLSMKELITSFYSLREELLNYIVAYDDPERDKTINFVIDKVSRNGNNIIVIVRTNLELGSLEVNSILSVHGKSNIKNILEKVKKLDKNIYETERTKMWLNSRQDKLADLSHDA